MIKKILIIVLLTIMGFSSFSSFAATTNRIPLKPISHIVMNNTSNVLSINYPIIPAINPLSANIKLSPITGILIFITTETGLKDEKFINLLNGNIVFDAGAIDNIISPSIFFMNIGYYNSLNGNIVFDMGATDNTIITADLNLYTAPYISDTIGLQDMLTASLVYNAESLLDNYYNRSIYALKAGKTDEYIELINTYWRLEKISKIRGTNTLLKTIEKTNALLRFKFPQTIKKDNKKEI